MAAPFPLLHRRRRERSLPLRAEVGAVRPQHDEPLPVEERDEGADERLRPCRYAETELTHAVEPRHDPAVGADDGSAAVDVDERPTRPVERPGAHISADDPKLPSGGV